VNANNLPFSLNFINFLSTDIDECEENIHNCHESATCNNSPGSYTCACNDGYTGVGSSCSGAYNISLIFYSFPD